MRWCAVRSAICARGRPDVAASRVYRAVLRCYPAPFRRRYGDDIIIAFDDLRADRGIRVAYWRALVDLVVTIPKYRLESAMSEHRARFTLVVLTITLAFAGFTTLAVGSWPVSVCLLACAALLSVSQRSAVAPGVPTRVAGRRRRLFVAAVVSFVVFACSVVAFLVDIGDDHVAGGALLFYNAIGMLSLVGGIVMTIALVNDYRQFR